MTFIFSFQTVRPSPVIPQKVAYLHFTELAKDARKIEGNWVVLKDQTDHLAIGLVDEKADVNVKVEFFSTYVPAVTYRGNSNVYHAINPTTYFAFSVK